MIDEYVALRVLGPTWDHPILDHRMSLPYTRQWRLLSAFAAPTARGHLSVRLQQLGPEAIEFIRRPHPTSSISPTRENTHSSRQI